jgi:hypothetical protein
MKETQIQEHECVDVCDRESLRFSNDAWDAGFSGGFFDRSYFDKGCSAALFESTEGAQMTSELADFADSLVFDERIGVCYAFDPRDTLKRRLAILD